MSFTNLPGVFGIINGLRPDLLPTSSDESAAEGVIYGGSPFDDFGDIIYGGSPFDNFGDEISGGNVNDL